MASSQASADLLADPLQPLSIALGAVATPEHYDPIRHLRAKVPSQAAWCHTSSRVQTAMTV
jgi:hypothetical protein